MAFGWFWILCCWVSTSSLIICHQGKIQFSNFESCSEIFLIPLFVKLSSYGRGKWRPKSRSTYNLYDPVVRSTVQVYPRGWSAAYAYLDNPGMWNLRSQQLKNWYLGEELYVRVYDADPNPEKERPPPDNIRLCGQPHCLLR